MRGELVCVIPVVAVVCGYFMSDDGFLFGLVQIFIDYMFSDFPLFLQCANTLHVIVYTYQSKPVPRLLIGWALLFWIIVFCVVAIPSFPFVINPGSEGKRISVLLSSLYKKIIQ